MKNLIFTLISLLHLSLVAAQKPFSRIYDDPNPTSIENGLTRLVIHDGKILVNTQKLCDRDTVFPDCTALSYLDLHGGNLLQWKELNDVTTVLRTGLMTDGDRIFLFCNYMSDFGFEGNRSQLIEFDKQFHQLNVTAFEGHPQKIFQAEGGRIVGNYMYLFGSMIDTSWSIYGYIRLIKYDYLNHKIIWDRNYPSKLSPTKCNDVQATPDGNLAFIMNVRTFGFQIIKINQEGDILNKFYFEDNSDQTNQLLVSSDGSYYCSSNRNPMNYWEMSSGRINKFNPSLDSMEWSLILPNDPVKDARLFKINNYLEAKNGDIIVCGEVFDVSDDIRGVVEVNTGWNGFMIRVTPQGKLLWQRIYRQPQIIMDQDTFGRFRNSILKEITELKTGQLVAGGEVYYNANQLYGIHEKGLKVERSHYWILLTDENGCLDPDNCDIKVYLTGTEDKRHSELTAEAFPNPAQDLLHIMTVFPYRGYLVSDLLGRSLLQGPEKSDIDVSSLPAGAYLLKLTSDYNTSSTIKFIKL